jgi:hypothetical protein
MCLVSTTSLSFLQVFAIYRVLVAQITPVIFLDPSSCFLFSTPLPLSHLAPMSPETDSLGKALSSCILARMLGLCNVSNNF